MQQSLLHVGKPDFRTWFLEIAQHQHVLVWILSQGMASSNR